MMPDLTIYQINDRLNIYEQNQLFQRQDIDELKKITYDHSKEFRDEMKTLNVKFTNKIESMNSLINNEFKEMRKEINEKVSGSHKWIIGILLGIIGNTALMVFAFINKGV
jgi:hypothetical protein